MSRIVVHTLGSLGDLHPYLAIGSVLRARGHDVVLATHAEYGAIVAGAGLGFAPVRPGLDVLGDPTAAMRRAMDLRRGSEFVLEEFVLGPLRASTEDVFAALAGADLVTSHVLSLGAVIAAEARRVPRVHTALQPMTMWSVHDPPEIPALRGGHLLRRLPAFVLAPARAVLAAATRYRFAEVDAVRRQFGLPRARAHPLFEMGSPLLNLALFSPLFGPPQPDWPVPTVATGFPSWHQDAPLEPALAAFLDAGEPPLVFTLGSSAVHDAGDFYVHARHAAAAVGARAVLLTGPDPANVPPGAADDPRVSVVPYAPHAPLFRRAAAVVHQGGIGTTAAALAAGRPMLVVPHSHDQPDNARRCARLGVAHVLARSRWSAAHAAAALRRLLGDAALRERAAAVGAQVGAEHGAERAADAIEACLRGEAPAGPAGRS